MIQRQSKAALYAQLAFWFIGLAAFFWFLLTFGVVEQLGFDAAHATSVARNLLDGNGLKTSIISNDALFGQQTIPATQTIWPPGLPIASATLTAVTGIDPAIGFTWINATAHLLTAVAVVAVLTMVGLQLPVALAAGLLCLMATPNWILVIRGHSEPAMALMSVLLLLTVMRALRSASSTGTWVALAIAIAAVGFLARYQSIALFGPLLVLALAGLCGQIQYRQTFQKSAAIAAGLLAVAAIYIGANMMMTGSATGSDSPFEGRDLAEVASALNLLPESAQVPAFVGQLILVSLLGIGALVLTARRRKITEHTQTRLVALLFSSFAVVSVVGMLAILTFLTPAYPWIARYFVPAIPMLVIAGIAIMLLASKRTEAIIQHGITGFVISVLAVSMAAATLVPASDLLDAAKGKVVAEATKSNESLAALLRSPTGPDRPVLMSNHPAFLGLHTTAPIIGTPFPDPAKPAWDEVRLASAVRNYDVSHIILFADYPQAWGRNDLTQVIDNRPAWIKLRVRTESVAIYDVVATELNAFLSDRVDRRHASRTPALAKQGQ